MVNLHLGSTKYRCRRVSTWRTLSLERSSAPNPEYSPSIWSGPPGNSMYPGAPEFPPSRETAPARRIYHRNAKSLHSSTIPLRCGNFTSLKQKSQPPGDNNYQTGPLLPQRQPISLSNINHKNPSPLALRKVFPSSPISLKAQNLC